MNWARLRYPGTAGPRPVAPLRAPVTTADRGPLDNVLGLQATAGNFAVASILASAHAQRDAAGWTGADASGQGWNVKARDVDKIRRVPIEGLKLGSSTAFVGDESKKTIESAEHRAIVLIPAGMKVGTAVDVMLHFHGWTHRTDDPHAGWRQHSGPDATVRDVDQDRIEAQLQAAGTQLVAILPQGVGESQFGKIPIEPYIKEVLGKVTAVKEFKDAKGNVVTTAPGLGRLVLSGHSGGGNRIMPALSAGSGKEPAEVILFEAIHHVDKFDAPAIVGNWATRHLEAVRKVLAATAPPPSPADRAKAIEACPRLRAYYSDYSGGTFKKDRYRKGYETNYERLAGILDAWFAKNGQDLGGDLAAVRARFKVQPLTGTGHETVVRGLGDDPFAGPLTDALVALDNPTAKSKLATSGTTTWTKPRRAKPKVKKKAPKSPAKPKGASTPPTPGSGAGSIAATSIGNVPIGATEIVAALDRAGVGNPTIAALLPTLLWAGEPLKVAATVLAMAGLNNDIDLTDALFDIVHRDLGGEPIAPDRDDLKAEWRTLRRTLAGPALAQLRDTPSPTGGTTATPADVVGPATGTVTGTPTPTPTTGTPTPTPTPTTGATVATGPPRAGEGVSKMTDARRKELIAAALTQATTEGDIEDREAIAATIVENGKTVEEWFGGIVPNATFLGKKIRASGGNVSGVHSELHAALVNAERALVAKYGKTPAELGTLLGVYDISGVRTPKKATGKGLPSYHCFGLAVDINHDTNPFVGNMKPKSTKKRPLTKEKLAEYAENRSPRIIERAMFLIHGETFDVESDLVPKGKKADKRETVAGSMKAYAIHKRTSQALADYLTLAADVNSEAVADKVKLRKGKGDDHDLAWWKTRMATDRDVIKNWDFQHHEKPEQLGYMDLNSDLVEALVGAKLLWGGVYRKEKDMMHFDLRGGTIQKRPKKTK